MRNRLAGESSPYLLQHAGNPVDWYPWSAEAFDHARSKNRPIFLSIGYSACHWCHVMEHESFTDASTAALMNDLFISIKVDREERPDLDAIYMQAVTMLTGQGGWPLSVWLTPQGVPFYGGTYFPPSPRYGRPSFRQVLEALAKLWKEHPEELDRAAARVLEHLSEEASPETAAASKRILFSADEAFHASFDPVHGGWGDAPKFPQPLALEYLLARRALTPSPHPDDQTATTLDSMAAGGLYDHLGGGFHRYSVDEAWRVPHFEKMLYDNAQLARCYLHAWQALGNDRYRVVTEETLDYLLDRMRHPQGGFFSAEDADSEGREGAFYTWTPDHLREALTSGEAELAATTYGVSAEGNFEGQNVLYLPADDRARDPALARVREKLRRVREDRVPPGRDDKILAGWNGIALAALAEAARVFRSERYLEAATQTGHFLQSALVRDGSRLAHSWKDGRALGNGFLDDYACTIEGLLALYQTTGEEGWFGLARDLTGAMSKYFRRLGGGFFDTSSDHERLILRPRSLQDSPTPCGNSMAATILLKMAALAGESGYRDLAEETLATTPPFVERAPTVAGQWLLAHLLAETGLTEIAIVGDAASAQTAALLAVVDRAYLPAAVTGRRSPGAASLLPMLLGREPAQGAVAAAWVCRQSACLAPTSDAARLKALLGV